MEDSVFDNKHLANQVAHLCYDHFDSLPRKGKPLQGREWTVVAAFIQRTGKDEKTKCSLKVISMGTGSKCVGQNKLSQNGDILNDSHAEVVARRGFLRYMYYKMEIAASGKENDLFIVDPISKKFLLKEGISFLFFSSHTPCGDSSIIVKENIKITPVTSDKLLEPSNIEVPCFDEEPPSKVLRFEIPDIHRTGAKCVVGGPQVVQPY
jgi:tRNA-specific adenosine deaminase 1